MNRKNNHKKLASVHISIALLILLVYFFTKNSNSNDSVILITIFIIASINLIIGIGCLLKVEFIRQTSQFFLITFLFSPPLLIFLIWWLPWSQWSNDHEHHNEKLLFNSLVFIPVFISFVILVVSLSW